MKCSISEKVKDIVYSARRHTLRSLASELDVSTSTEHDNFETQLGISKVCARWVRRLLKDYQRETRVRYSEEFVWR